MGRYLRFGSIAAFGAVLLCTASAQAQKLVSLDVSSVDLTSAIQTLMKRSGLQVVVDPNSGPFHKVTLHVTDLPAEDVIRYICESAGASFTRDDNGVYLLSTVKAAGSGAAPAVAPTNGKLLRKHIRVMKADPKSVLDAVMYRASLNPNLHWAKLDEFRKSHGILTSDIFHSNDFNIEFAAPVSETSRPRPTHSGIELPGSDFNPDSQAAGGGQLGGGFGGGQGGGQGFGGGQGQGGGQGAPTLQGGQGLVPAGITFIGYDPTDNSFIVEGTDEAIQEFIRLVNEFDEAPRAVVVKVEFVTTSSSISKSLGFDFTYSRGTVFGGTTPGSNARAGDPVFLNFGLGNVAARMRTQILEGYGKVVNSPSVRTLNNQPASFFSTIQTTLFINQIVGTGNGTVIVSPQPVPINIATGITVAPRINGDGTITMSLSPQIQDFGQLRRGPDGQEIPDILSQQINVVARVKNDETIVLGGLTRGADQGSEARTPILSDLPIIGQMFRSDNKDKNKSELLIFVTAHIVQEDEGSGGG